MLIDTTYNPDVLSCLANLSSDEVFTPPEVANQALDLLPTDLWSNPNATFLDPVCKSGVFLREIAKRLNDGLADQIPDLQERINHIFQNQLFGIGITNITALLSRRSVYCSMDASGKYSVAEGFTGDQGNIIFKRVEHDWVGGKCRFCGASETEYERDEALESHAYQFIHTDHPEDIFDMKFDVVIGNPPYQLSDGGHGRSAKPIYNLFVDQAKKLNPNHLVMIIPSRWMGGGKGLNSFRESMLADDQIREIVDFEDASEVFPGVDMAGGVCYFHWERGTSGDCVITNKGNGEEVVTERPLNEFSTLVRHGSAIPIIHKITANGYPTMDAQVSNSRPFGLRTYVRPMKKGDIQLRWQHGTGPYLRSEITTGEHMIDKWKVITSYVGYDHAGSPGKDGRRRVFSRIDILPPGTICNETYLVIGAFDSETEASNLVTYMKTRFFRFLVSQFMFSHHITRDTYRLVPVLDMQESWNDERLAKLFGLSKSDTEFIESKIRQME